MFAQLFFIILTLLIINIVPTGVSAGQEESLFNLLEGLTLYLVTLILIVLQNILFSRKKNSSSFLTIFSNLELCACLLILITLKPLFHSSSLFLVSFTYLALYFFGLATHYLFQTPEKEEFALPFALRQVRFYFPFVIPFLLLNGLYDAIRYLDLPLLENIFLGQAETLLEFIYLLGSTGIILLTLISLFPPILLYFWGCTPLHNSELKQRLDRLCHKAGFRHGGLKVWSIMKDSYTAAIIGIVPRFRFVMFTDKLLKQCPPDYTEAILCHEIGHSQRKHLFYYPFILLGMMLTTSILTSLFGEGIIHFFAYRKALGSTALWEVLEPVLLFSLYALVLFAYFRLIFGYFSRCFERQADLHVYELSLKPENMVGALDLIGVLTGYSHRRPSWHHYSIWQRMEFLKSSIQNPALVRLHHRKVRRSLGVYALFLAFILLIFASFYSSETSTLKPVANTITTISNSFDSLLNDSSKQKLTNLYLEDYNFLNPTVEVNRTVIEQSLSHPGSLQAKGVSAFYAAQYLLQAKRYKESLLMMTRAWRETRFQIYPPDVKKKYLQVTRQIVEQTGQTPWKKERQALLKAMKRKIKNHSISERAEKVSQALEVIIV